MIPLLNNNRLLDLIITNHTQHQTQRLARYTMDDEAPHCCSHNDKSVSQKTKKLKIYMMSYMTITTTKLYTKMSESLLN